MVKKKTGRKKKRKKTTLSKNSGGKRRKRDEGLINVKFNNINNGGYIIGKLAKTATSSKGLPVLACYARE